MSTGRHILILLPRQEENFSYLALLIQTAHCKRSTRSLHSGIIRLKMISILTRVATIPRGCRRGLL